MYGSVWAEIGDGSSSTDILYVIITLVQDVGSFLGINVDTLKPDPQTYEIA